MAIINSMGVGRSKKSMGNVTYRVVRGRTIGSQKRGQGATGATTRGMQGNLRKPLFAMINMFMSAHKTDIQVSFNKSQYGSQRNYFFTVNYSALATALQALAVSAAGSGLLPLESEIESAITAYATANPSAIYRVKLAGFENVFMTGAWSSEDNPISGGSADGLGTGQASITVGSTPYTAPLAFSINMHAGAKIQHGEGTVTLTGNAIPAGVVAADIIYYTPSGAISPAITVSNVVSEAGSLSYTAPSIAESSNVIAVGIKTVYTRLTSAYLAGGKDDNPLG